MRSGQVPLLIITRCGGGQLRDCNHHGIIVGGSFEKANNDKLPYLQNGAYTANNRFFDRAISREAYLLSNDIINLGIKSSSDGHLDYATPCNHATLEGGAVWQESHSGRNGVVKVNGGKVVASGKPMKDVTNVYCIEGWFYITEWNAATLFACGDDFSIRLGGTSDSHKLVVNVSGVAYTYDCGTSFPTNQWVFLGFSSDNGNWYLNLGTGWNRITSVTPNAPSAPTPAIPSHNGTCVFVDGLMGYADQLTVWSKSFNAAGIWPHSDVTKLPIPNIGVKQVATEVAAVRLLYQFDKEEQPGYDSFSQDEWLRIMKTAFDGYRGYKMRITVEGHTNWQNTIADATARQNFATDLARLSAPYDGVELDLEWSEVTDWDPYNQLIDAIKAVLPSNKTFHVSAHNYTHKFVSVDRFPKVDGFTFQQYGPDQRHFDYASFTNGYNDFVNRGYPNKKIYLSYATTTSKKYDDNENMIAAINGIAGYTMPDDYTPGDKDRWDVSDGHYYFQSPMQVYRRAQFATDHDVEGIFYWDMANDYKPDNKWMYAKMASYGLNANVDRIVTDATPIHPEGVDEDIDENVQLNTDDVDDINVPSGVLVRGTRVISGNQDEKLVDGAYIALMQAPSSSAGKVWLGDASSDNSYSEAEKVDMAAIFKLESAGNGQYYMQNVVTEKYIGRKSKNFLGVSFDFVMCETRSDGNTSKLSFSNVTASNNSVYGEERDNFYNVSDKNQSTRNNCLLPTSPASFGSSGTSPSQIWQVYSFNDIDFRYLQPELAKEAWQRIVDFANSGLIGGALGQYSLTKAQITTYNRLKSLGTDVLRNYASKSSVEVDNYIKNVDAFFASLVTVKGPDNMPVMVTKDNISDCIQPNHVIALRWITNSNGNNEFYSFNGENAANGETDSKWVNIGEQQNVIPSPSIKVLYWLVASSTADYYYLQRVSDNKYVGGALPAAAANNTVIQMVNDIKSANIFRFALVNYSDNSHNVILDLTDGFIYGQNVFGIQANESNFGLKPATFGAAAQYGDFSENMGKFFIWGVYDFTKLVSTLTAKGDLTTGDNVYNTISNLNEYDFTIMAAGDAEVKANGVTLNVEKTSVSLTPVSDNLLQSMSGVVVSGCVGDTYYLKPTDSQSNIPTGLSVATGPFESTGDYVLAYPKGGTDARFYVTNGLSMKVGQVYLAGSALTNNIQSLRIVAGDNVDTGIADMQDEPSSCDAVYNLGGQRVNNPSSGIYIIGGKKVVIK